MIAVVDCGNGNLGSILNMLRKAGAAATATADPNAIAHADRLILPGIGAFDAGMQRLDDAKLLPVLHEQVIHLRKPLLGICLGMQLLMERSEEGSSHGLGWLRGSTVKFRSGDGQPSLCVPHMGWNTVEVQRVDPLFTGLETGAEFYFVHSYHVVCDAPGDVVAVSRYGRDFTCAVRRDNICGVQFHPEKSHRFGLRLLQNFARDP